MKDPSRKNKKKLMRKYNKMFPNFKEFWICCSVN